MSMSDKVSNTRTITNELWKISKGSKVQPQKYEMLLPNCEKMDEEKRYFEVVDDVLLYPS